MSKFARLIAGGGIVAALVLGGGGVASAHHAGETVSVSKTTGLKDGDTVTVSFTHFTPNAKPVKVVIAGQGLTTIPDKLNFDEYAAAPPVAVNADGTGSAQYLVYADHGTQQDGSHLDCNTMPCWIVVVQEPFLPQPNYNSVRITFGAATAPTTTAKAVTTTAAPSTTAATAATVPTTLAAPTTTAVPEASAPTTTEAPTTSTTSTTVVLSGSKASSTKDDDGSNTGVIIAGIVAAVAVLGGGAFAATRRKPPTSTPPPAPLA